MIDPSVLEGVLAAGAGAGIYAFARRFGTAGTLAELATANRLLLTRIRELHDADERKTHEIAELRARTDVSLALAPLLEWTVSHETRAQERHDATMHSHTSTLKILELIAERLGPDSEPS